MSLDKYAGRVGRSASVKRELLRHASCDRCVFFEAETAAHENRCHHTATFLECQVISGGARITYL